MKPLLEQQCCERTWASLGNSMALPVGSIAVESDGWHERVWEHNTAVDALCVDSLQAGIQNSADYQEADLGKRKEPDTGTVPTDIVLGSVRDKFLYVCRNNSNKVTDSEKGPLCVGLVDSSIRPLENGLVVACHNLEATCNLTRPEPQAAWLCKSVTRGNLEPSFLDRGADLNTHQVDAGLFDKDGLSNKPELKREIIQSTCRGAWLRMGAPA